MKENGGGVLYGVHLAAIRARLLGTFPSFSSAALGDRPVVRTPYLTPGHRIHRTDGQMLPRPAVELWPALNKEEQALEIWNGAGACTDKLARRRFRANKGMYNGH